MPQQTSPAVEDYLKAIWHLEFEDRQYGPITGAPAIATKALAVRLGVSAASATNMLKRLADLGLVEHVPYRGASLTEAGGKIALEVIRHHRLLETYLAEALGVPWEQVHEEAEVLEHVLSEDLEDRIALRLGDPRLDPHGHPIPAKDGSMPAASGRRLWDAADGEEVRVARVSDDRADGLRYLDEIGVRPGSDLAVTGRGPVGGPLFVSVCGGEERALSQELAEEIWVD